MITLKMGERLIIFNESFESMNDEISLVVDDNGEQRIKLDMDRYMDLWDFYVYYFAITLLKIKKMIPVDVNNKQDEIFSSCNKKIYEYEILENYVITGRLAKKKKIKQFILIYGVLI